MRYTYVSGSGTSSVRIDSYNFVTRKTTYSMDYIASVIHEILISNIILFNLNGVDKSQKFNHCIVIIYYAGEDLKDKSLLGMNSDCVYSVTDRKCMKHPNSQVKHNPVVIIPWKIA